MSRLKPGFWILTAVFAAGFAGVAIACPFCGQVQPTIGSTIESADVAAIVSLAEDIDAAGDGAAVGPLGTAAKFEVVKPLKGDDLKVGETVEAFYVETAKMGDVFLLAGQSQPALLWGYPMPLSYAASEYLPQRVALPEVGPDRLKFFQSRLQDGDALIAEDAYAVFAVMPYETLIELKDHLDREQLVAWIRDEGVSPRNKRLYLTLLGLCGSEADAPMIEALWANRQRATIIGLDALLASYVALKGEPAVKLVEDRYLKTKGADYGDISAAIAALRFHGDENRYVERQRIVEAFRLVLDQPTLADLVIADLMRWKDWSVMPRLVELFETADEESFWVRLPVLHFLMACPLPEAKTKLNELADKNPEVYQHALAVAPPGVVNPDGTLVVDKPTPELPSDVDPVPPPTTDDDNGEPAEAAVTTPSNSTGVEPSSSEGSRPPARWSLLWGLPFLGVIVVVLLMVRAARQNDDP